MTRRLELTLPSTPTGVRNARDTVAAIASDYGAGDQLVEDLRLCVSEAATNVVRHAYDGVRGEVRVLVDWEAGELVVTIDDAGVGLSEFRREGELGYGLRIIEMLSDRCRFAGAVGSGTHVEMAFKVDGSEGPSGFCP
jgi:anti-sigma regulatory factor (Ser/Thr protein kinase)